ncbi:MAG: Mur ligase family protein [Bryobacteraceae bacterium]
MKYLLLTAYLAFAWRRLSTYLHIFQQEEYQPVRFIRWLFVTRSLDLRVSVVILVVGALQFAIRLDPNVGALFITAALLGIALYEKKLRAASKKKLVMTPRATRIYWVAFSVVALIGVLYAFTEVPLLLWLVPVHAVPFALPIATLILAPQERSVQKKFWNEAHGKLKSINPTVIGITGSYGKTSTKHLLGHILELQAPTLITPGSVNTPMGVSRVIREQLGAHHRFFVCEMGAYGPGSIARLCRLAPPDVAVITAIGMAHYERFKTLDTVATAKFELAHAAAQRHGETILSDSVLEFETARAFKAQHPEKTVAVGFNSQSEFRIVNAGQTRDGIMAQLMWKDQLHTLRAPIFGEHHIGNMAVAFATACCVGIVPQDAILALHSAPQISHRLEVKEGPNGSRLIDDAYNSNPVGFASALKLLNDLRVEGGRRILVTPGMVELGTAHEEEHEKIGLLAKSTVDILLAVVPARIASLVAGFQLDHPAAVVVPCPNFAAAQAWMNANLGPADIVLLENDLPDLYEKQLSL